MPLILRYAGPNFFAAVSTLGEELPTADRTSPGVVIFDLGAMRHYSSTLLKQLENFLDELNAAGSRLVLLQVENDERRTLERIGLLDRIGPDNVLPTDSYPDRLLESGLRRGIEVLAEINESRADDLGPPTSDPSRAE